MNCTARITRGPRRGVGADAERRGVARRALRGSRACRSSKCEVYKHTLGGGFGRRGGAQDYVRQAVAIAKQFPGVPVKMIWSREEDMTHDFYRPISQCRLAAGLDATASSSGCTCASRASRSTRSSTRRRRKRRQGRPAAAGLLREARRRAAGLHRAEPAGRIRDAQHARAGRPVARRQHQPERRLHGVLHRRGGARGRDAGSARVPPRADAASIRSISRCSTPRRRRPAGASRCRRACIAASRSSWATAAIRRRWPRCRWAPRARSRCTAWCWR